MTAASITNIQASFAKPATSLQSTIPLVEGLSAPNVLLMGPPGSGKTWAITTLIEQNIEVFCIITEPNGLQNLLKAMQVRKLPMDKLHWHYVPPMAANWAALEDLTKTINMQSYSAIADLKQGISKAASGNVMKVLKSIQNFICDRTKLSYGDATLWSYDRALVVDSLSGLNILCVQNTVGLKPTLHMGEWGTAMNFEETLINKLTSDMRAYFVLLAHVDRNVNETTGATIITPAAVGSKLGPKVGRFFSEVVLTIRKDDKFFWSTSESGTDVKQSSLPISKTLEASFAPIVKSFNETLKLLSN